MARLALIALALLSALVAAPAAQAKTKGVFWQQKVGNALRVDHLIGFVTINGIQGPGDPPQTVRSGKTTYKVSWINATYGGQSTKALMRRQHKDSRYGPVNDAIFSDASLRGKWKKRFSVMVDLGRDADVMVVAAGHPVCQTGLTMAQAKGIARGKITDWGQVGAPGAGAIKRRLLGSGQFTQTRFGTPQKVAKQLVAADGGVSQAAKGDQSIAAVTAWSKARYASGTCAVPINGVAPSNQTVFDRSYGPAYPIQYLMHRKRRRDKEGAAMIKAFVAFLKSDKAAKLFRANGMLLVADGPGGGGPSGGGGGSGEPVFGTPTTDAQGRPITATRDDAAAAEAMKGRRLQAGSRRLVFDADGRFADLAIDEFGQCVGAEEARWAILEAWTYPEHGGGLYARVRSIHSDHERLYEIDISGDAPGQAWVNGQPFSDDPSLSGGCG